VPEDSLNVLSPTPSNFDRDARAAYVSWGAYFDHRRGAREAGRGRLAPALAEPDEGACENEGLGDPEAGARHGTPDRNLAQPPYPDAQPEPRLSGLSSPRFLRIASTHATLHEVAVAALTEALQH
jgi:hypothetical protein